MKTLIIYIAEKVAKAMAKVLNAKLAKPSDANRLQLGDLFS